MRGLLISIETPESPGLPGVYVVSHFDGELVELQAAVGGLVDVAPSSDHVSLWINDEGKHLALPINRLAMDVWLRWDDHGCMLLGRDWLAGNVVVTGGVDRRGNTRDIPMEAARWVLSVARDAGARIEVEA